MDNYENIGLEIGCSLCLKINKYIYRQMYKYACPVYIYDSGNCMCSVHTENSP